MPPKKRAKEVFRLKMIWDKTYSEKQQRQRLLIRLRGQKKRLEETLAIIQEFCGKDVTKLSAFETLLKTNTRIKKETKSDDPPPALAIAVVRPTAAVVPSKPTVPAVVAPFAAGPSSQLDEKVAAVQEVIGAV